MTAEPKLADLVAWLEDDEAGSRQHRARRLARMMKTLAPTEEGLGLWGGISSSQSFAEMRLAYIHGLYLSTVLLALACIEQELAGMLHAGGWDKARSARLEMLLQEALIQKIITDKEADAFNHLRDVRNAYAHYRQFGDTSTWTRRAIDEALPLEDVLEGDAAQAVEVLGRFLARRMGYV